MPHHPIFTVLVESLFALKAEQILRRLERGLPSHLGGQQHWIWMGAVIGSPGHTIQRFRDQMAVAQLARP
jgi:hypothetical protein